MNVAVVIRSIALLLTCLLWSEGALAHVKWFVEFDLSEAPRSLLSFQEAGYSPLLLLGLALFGVALAGWLDNGWYYYSGHSLGGRSDHTRELDDRVLTIARIGAGVFGVMLWLKGDVILAPELRAEAGFLPWLHVLLAFAVLFRSTLFLAGLSLLTLFGYGVAQYGLFHMLDYTLVVGMGLFLLMSYQALWFAWEKRFHVLYFSLVFSFLWSAVEKIAYPQWSQAFLEQYPSFTLGFEADFYILAAALVEFTLFFLLLASHKGVVLLAVLANLLLITGSFYLGKDAAVGYFLSNAVLVMVMVKGPLPVNAWFFNQMPLREGRKTWMNLVVFLLVFAAMLALYYGLHWLLFGN